MAKKTIVGKIIESILSAFKSNWIDWIVKIAKKVPKELQDELATIVEIVNVIKKMADSPIADIIVKATPTKWDDAAKVWLSEALGRWLEKYNDLSDDGNIQSIATRLTQEATGMSYGQSAVTIEAKYQMMKQEA